MVTSSAVPAGTPAIIPVRTQTRRKHRLFLITNALVVLFVIFALATNRHAELHIALYVTILFLICSLPLLFITSYRGRESLLLIFMAYYFGSFGLKDLSNLVAYEPISSAVSGAGLSGGEIAILIGAVCFILGYQTIASLIPKHNAGLLTRDWSPKTIVALGILFWTIGFYINAIWQFGIGDRYSGTTISAEYGGFISLLRMLQTLGTLLLIYLYLSTRNKVVLLILLFTIIADFGLGFVGDSKEIAFRDLLLYIFSVLVLRERLPIVEGIVFILIAGVGFSFFSAYRLNLHSRHESREKAIENIGNKLNSISLQDKSLGKQFSSGIDYFASRITLKQNVELIVAETGKSVEFQEGNTIKPLLYAFVPRFIMPNKQDNAAAGKIFNQEFRISGDRNTYISVSQIGEMYWNFGWPGLIIGMMAIGIIMALVAVLMRLDTNPTLPRFLFLLMTIYLLVLRFEAGIALAFTVWARATVLLLVLHAITPKKKTRRTTIPLQTFTVPAKTPLLKKAYRA
jgi:hypothetical protein